MWDFTLLTLLMVCLTTVVLAQGTLLNCDARLTCLMMVLCGFL